ncbi:MAG: UDP-N-acetylmuramate dehydrogenase [Culturomica sp.]|jgi:UDP-N-acetylmuramate dehydrogenase|nr:UDP-N-acetylmuramate dehydrogenase [Culturomica sp.]
MRIEENFDLKPHNTFAVSARCRYFVESDSEAEWLDFAKQYEWKPEQLVILGGGSNFLFTEDFDGTVLYPTIPGITLLKEEGGEVLVRAGAGVVWDDFVAWAVEREYGGVENLSLIPGHVGAAPVQNVGAYGMEAGDTIDSVEAIDLEQAVRVRIPGSECGFSYRDSLFKHSWKNRYLITHVTFRLHKNPLYKLEYGSIREEIGRLGLPLSVAAVRQAVIGIRTSKLPDVREWPNAGSFFRNPVVSAEFAAKLQQQYPAVPLYPAEEGRVKVAAGWLIEQAGWKGKTLGNAGVYDRQALVLVNRGGATGVEISCLANAVKKEVFLRFGIWIEPEVNIV